MSHVRSDEERFLQVTLDSVPGAGDKERCRSLLAEALGHTATLVPPPKGDSLETVTKRMEQTAARGGSAKWRRVWLLVVLAVSLWPGMINPDAINAANAAEVKFSGYSARYPLWNTCLGTNTARLAEERLTKGLSADARLTLFGDTSQSKDDIRWKVVWEAHPDDPVLYNRYALALLGRTAKLPDDYVETGERIDPGNGWYRCLKAFETWNITVPSRAEWRQQTAVALPEIRKAMAMPRFDSHRDEFVRRQIAALPRPQDYAHIVQLRTLILHEDSALYEVFDRYLALWQRALETDQDSPVTDEAPALFKVYAGKLVRDSKCLPHLGRLVAGGFMQALVQRLVHLVPKSTPEEAAKLSSMAGLMEPATVSWNRSQPTSFLPVPGLDAWSQKATDQETKPTASAARAMVERLSLRFALLIAVLGLGGCGLCHDRWRRAVRPLPERLGGLLRLSDYGWILAVGWLLPLGIYLTLVRSAGFGLMHRPISVSLIANYQFVAFAMVISMLVLTIEMVRWRLGKRGAVLGFQSRGFNPGRWFSALALASFATGWLPTLSFIFTYWLPSLATRGRVAYQLWPPVLWAVPLLALSWPVILFWWGRSHTPERRLHRSTIARVLLAPLALICLTLVGMILLSHEEDRYWTRRDTLETPRTEWAGNLSAEEERTAVARQRRLLEILGMP